MSATRPVVRVSIVVLLVSAAAMLFGPASAHADSKSKNAPPPPVTKSWSDFGLNEDPGPDPNPQKLFYRYGKVYTIAKFEKKYAVYDQKPGWVRPSKLVNIGKEIYREDAQNVWVFMPVRMQEPAAEAPPPPKPVEISKDDIKYFEDFRGEFTPLVPPSSGKTIVFHESSDGLPQQGSWRNALDVADMNEDGKLDIITPPQRGGAASIVPHIFLGDGQGHWKNWSEVTWPKGLNYGSVVAGDVNGDGHQDLIFGVHLYGVVVFLGDGKGHFTDSSDGLPTDFPVRQVRVADMDGDGEPDIIALSEGPQMFDQKRSPGTNVRIYLNRQHGKKWQELNVAEDGRLVAGNGLALGRFNGDAIPDIVGSSIYFSGPDLMYLSDGKTNWKAFGRGFLPFDSYYLSVATGKLSSRTRDDAVLGFMRIWPPRVDPKIIAPPKNKEIVGVERVAFDEKGNARRVPIARWISTKAVAAVATGDFDGDGNVDVVYLSNEPREFVVLLGDGKGGLKSAKVQGIPAYPNTAYSIGVADVNGDHKDDLLIMYESEETASPKNGSMHVYLSGGTGSAKQ